MPLVATRGAASAQGFGEFAQSSVNYIEDVFSTYLYTGNGTSQTITNGINLSGQGGLVWLKKRSAIGDNFVIDSNRQDTPLSPYTPLALYTNSTSNQFAAGGSVTALNSTGFSLGAGGGYATNDSGATYASWTFRKQAKFFDVVTWTGNNLSSQTILHNLQSAPGCIIIKATNTTQNWWVYHRSTGTGNYLVLNTTATQVSGTIVSAVSSTDFTVGSTVTSSGITYVAYLFAHNAGGFGAAGTDNVISCGSYTGNGSTAFREINLGYEPQWVLIKNVTTGGYNWMLADSMRGLLAPKIGVTVQELKPNTSDAEAAGRDWGITATGIGITDNNASINALNDTYIYIAIRRGPMRAPTTGTSVFSPITANAAAGTVQTTGFVVDSQWKAKRTTDTLNTSIDDRLRKVSTTNTGSGNYLITSSNSVGEATTSETTRLFNNTGFLIPAYYSSTSTIFYSFGRAPGFFDVVCYTGTGSARTVSHNLNVVPELMIVRERTGASSWPVYNSAGGNTSSLFLESTNTYSTPIAYWNSTTPTSSVFSLAGGNPVNATGGTYVAYLFATCPGVSKVGSYTGSGTTKQIDCGFTGGARFVMIKRTDAADGWFVWDSARGIVAGNDPYLLFNSTAAEVTNTDYVDTYSAGFEISSTAPTGINANGGTFIFLAIA